MRTKKKDRFGDTMRLVARAREDIYFAEPDGHLLAVPREKMKKVEGTGNELCCPKCLGILDTYIIRIRFRSLRELRAGFGGTKGT